MPFGKIVYIVVSATTAIKLQEAVNEKIAEGYTPIGGLARGASHFYQAMQK